MSAPRSRVALASLAAAAAVLAGLLAPASATAAGAQYNVLKCHESYGAWSTAESYYYANGGNYQEVPGCENPDFRYGGVRTTGGNNNGLYAQWQFFAPAGTVISGITASVNLRRQEGHQAQYGYWDTVGNFVTMDGVDTPGGGWKQASYRGPFQASAVGVRLICNQVCKNPAPGEAHAYIRQIEIFVQDVEDPVFTRLAGGLVQEGRWHRGSQRLEIGVTDRGSGLEFLSSSVNGTGIAWASPGCPFAIEGPYARRMTACNGVSEYFSDYDTRDAALGFRDGLNHMEVVAEDFAGNRVGRTFTVLVDNAPPAVAFANEQSADDPELVRAPVADEHSGIAHASMHMRRVGSGLWEPLESRIAGGELRARVDSLSYAPGEYEFLARASDVAGNDAETTQRQNGAPMRLTFPLRTGVELQAALAGGGSERQAIPYGRTSAARGRLLSRSGEPLAGKEITVTEHFGDGALIRERVSQATTDDEGNWESRIPAGPSRTVEATFAGTARYAPGAAEVGRLGVKSRASFRTSRASAPEGSAVAFEGKVRHKGARIPVGGKLVELQVEVEPKEWDTVGEAFRTEPNGAYRTRYRFGNHYTSDVRFHFRVKVQNEGDWPYKRAATKQRAVTIRAR